MPPGKLSAQSGHAYTDSLFGALDRRPDLAERYRRNGSGGSKVTLKAKNLESARPDTPTYSLAAIANGVVASQNNVPEEDLYTYVIVRRDLAMAPGKIASQAVHAARLSLLSYIKQFPERIDEFISKNLCGSAVVLYGRNLHDLEIAHERARDIGLPTALFKDSGHIPATSMSGDGIVSEEQNLCFDGQSIVTALGIGPCTREEARAITKRFKLV